MIYDNKQISVQILELDKEHIRFEVNNIDLSMANSLRRIMIAEIPTVAIDFVYVHKNTSQLIDEYISHRLGLTPLISSKAGELLYPKDCTCQGKCDKCKVYFRLHAKCGPDQDQLEVTSMDLKRMFFNENQQLEEDDVQPVKFYDVDGNENGVVIAQLSRNQELEIECEARKGIGKLHSKWTTVCTVNLEQKAVIKLDDKINDLTTDQKQQFVDSCPTKVYEINQYTKKVQIADGGLDKCIFCGECQRKIDDMKIKYETFEGKELQYDNEQLLQITQSKDKFVFNVETNGALSPEEVVKSAFREMVEKLKEIQINLPGKS